MYPILLSCRGETLFGGQQLGFDSGVVTVHLVPARPRQGNSRIVMAGQTTPIGLQALKFAARAGEIACREK